MLLARVRFQVWTSRNCHSLQMGPRNSFRLTQLGSMFTQMNPAKVSQGHLLQAHLAARIAFRKIFPVRREVEFAVRHPRPTVVLAHETAHAPLRVLHQRVAPVLADVVEGSYAAVLLADHEDLLRPHRLHLPVAGIGQFGLAAEQQPHLCPHPFPFLFEERPGGVAMTLEQRSARLLLGIALDFVDVRRLRHVVPGSSSTGCKYWHIPGRSGTDPVPD